jgi:hypothetical protein
LYIPFPAAPGVHLKFSVAGLERPASDTEIVRVTSRLIGPAL